MGDTVVAIPALVKYAKGTFGRKRDVSVTISGTSGFKKQFNLGKDNQLLQQASPLPVSPGTYSVVTRGSGCVFLQAVMKFNVFPQPAACAFDLKVELQPKNCTKQNPRLESLLISVSYNGRRNNSNMVLIEVEMLSGFTPTDDTETELLRFPSVKRVVIRLDHVTIYLDELHHGKYFYFIGLRQDNLVQNLQPAFVKVYDNYRPEESCVSPYIPTCP
ncbi:alpha-2-macroglobulin-like protein 1 [Discoglossus pictus]